MSENEQLIIPENVMFVPRGQKEVNFEFGGYTVIANLRVLTNKEVDEFMSRFVIMDNDEPDVDNAGLAEGRIVNCLIEINTTFKGKSWSELTNEGKRDAVSCMHPKLRERLGKEIFGQTHLSKEDKDFLESPF